MLCTWHHCKQRFLVLLSRLFLSVHQAGLSLARSCRSGLHQLSLIPLPRCPQNGDCLHAIPSGSVWLMLSVLNVDHETIDAIIFWEQMIHRHIPKPEIINATNLSISPLLSEHIAFQRQYRDLMAASNPRFLTRQIPERRKNARFLKPEVLYATIFLGYRLRFSF